MRSENSSEYPMRSEKSSEYPMRSGKSSEYPMRSEKYSEYSMRSEKSSEYPMISEKQYNREKYTIHVYNYTMLKQTLDLIAHKTMHMLLIFKLILIKIWLKQTNWGAIVLLREQIILLDLFVIFNSALFTHYKL